MSLPTAVGNNVLQDVQEEDASWVMTCYSTVACISVLFGCQSVNINVIECELSEEECNERTLT